MPALGRRAVRALDHRVHHFTDQPLVVELVFNPRVVRVIVRREDTVFDQWTHVFSMQFLTEAHIVVALVGGETEQVARVPQGDLRADIRPIGPLRTAMDVDDRALRGTDEKCRLHGLYVSITPLEIVTRCFSAVKVGGIDGGVTGLVEQLRLLLEPLSPDSHRRSIKGLAQRRRTKELAALEDERGSYAFHLFGPVEDFGECRVHMLMEKVQDGVLPAGNGVAGRINELRAESGRNSRISVSKSEINIR